LNNEKIIMKDSLRKLRFKDIDQFHLGWYSKYNNTLAYSAKYRQMCIYRCGLCYALEQGLLRRFIESLNGCEESLEFLGDYFATILPSKRSEDRDLLKDQAMKFGSGFDPTEQEVEAFFDKAVPGLRSHHFKSNDTQGYGVDDLTNLLIFFDRKFFNFLDWYLPREKIHDQLCGSSAQGFLREMEDYSGDYGTEDNQPYYTSEEHMLNIPKRIRYYLADYRTARVDRYYPDILDELEAQSRFTTKTS